MLRAIGMTRRQVRRMIRHESVITALIGGVLGIVLGVVLGALLIARVDFIEFALPTVADHRLRDRRRSSSGSSRRSSRRGARRSSIRSRRSSTSSLGACSVTLCDVGPRDGLQNEPETLAPDVRAELVRRLAAAGCRGSRRSASSIRERVPQMAGAEEVVAAVGEVDAELSGLVLNERGWERLAATPLDRVNVTLAATETFNQRNGNATLEEAAARVERILAVADRPSRRRSASLRLPVRGRGRPRRRADLAERLVAAGAGEVVLADTIGVATPRPVRRLLERISILGVPVGGHFHDTRHTGVACAWAAVEAGAAVLDASVGGLGGCPFAPRATGNVATEDVLYLLDREGVETGVDLDALIGVAHWLEEPARPRATRPRLPRRRASCQVTVCY